MKLLIKTITRTCEKRGFIFNWLGRRYEFPNMEFSYTAPNTLIQGGAADVMKVALNAVDNYLRGRKSRLVLTVHDELDLEIHESEPHVAIECRDIVANVFPSKYLPLTAGLETSRKSLADLQKGLPQ